MTAAELRALRATQIANARGIVTGAETANRDMTDDESNRFDTAMREADELGKKITAAERKESLDQAEAELRQTGARRSAPAGTNAGTGTRELTAAQATEVFRAWALAGSPEHRPDADMQLRAAQAGVDLGRQVMTLRAMSVGTTTAGGHTVQQSFSSELEKVLLYYFTAAEAFDIFSTDDGADYPWPTVDDTANSGEFVAEAGALAVNQDPTFAQITYKSWDWYSPVVKVAHQLLRDSARNVPALLAELFAERKARKLDSSCVGTNAGTTAPEGCYNGVTVGAQLATANPITYAKLLAVESSVPLAYRNQPGVGWLMHDGTWQAIRGLVDTNGRPLVGMDMQNGVEKRLLGYPVHISNNVTSHASPGSNQPLSLFGALKKYKIRRVGGSTLTRLNELYAANGQVGFVLHEAFDGRWITKAGVRTLNCFT